MSQTSKNLDVKSASILVVDDHANVSKLVEAYVSKAGLDHIEIDHAANIEIALIRISQKRPNIVLLDNLLPPHFDFRYSVQELRAAYEGPLVLFSGEIPNNIGTHEIDNSLSATMSKDDISTERFTALIKKYI
ncbi:response regulator [Hirschia litorea]|uniref:Response regulator n=1 Tax=Hirschia litorea TaxID=1199156 RepID=A0ABW2IHL1_9PROT